MIIIVEDNIVFYLKQFFSKVSVEKFTSYFCRETTNENKQFLKTKWISNSNSNSDHAFKGIVVNQTCQTIIKGSL